MNPDWQRQIFAIFAQHFQTAATDASLTIHLHGRKVVTQQVAEWVEFRLAGPLFTQVNSREWQVDVTVNLLCKVLMSDSDIYRLEALLGPMSAACSEGIGGDCLTGVCFFDRTGNIRTTRFGQIDPTSRILMASIEADYMGFITAA
jgi:hypothetical protein